MLLDPSPDVGLLALPCIDPSFGRIVGRAVPGTTISEMVASTLPEAKGAERARLRVTVNGHVILPGLWHVVKPKAGAQVVIRVVPGGDILKNVLMVALTVAAIAAGQFYGPLLAGQLVFGAGAGIGAGALGTVLTAAISATVLVAGTLLINALIPPRTDKKDAPSYTINSLKNQATPDGVLPLVLGRMRYAPVFAGLPYTETVGNDRYIRALFTWGYGPLQLSNFRIGETPIEKYQECQFEIRNGYASDAQVTLYPNQVIEQPLSVELLSGGPGAGPQSRYTAADATECSIDIGFPGGLGGVDKDGKKVAVACTFTCRYRLAGTEPWTGSMPIFVNEKLSGKAFTRTFPIAFPTRGRWEIELTRTSSDFDRPDQDLSAKEIQRTGRSQWTTLRSVRPEYPVNFGKPIALAAVRIKATGQLNGTLDEFNCDVQSLCPDWDAASNTYITRATSNPASLFRYVLNGPGITYPLSDSEIDGLKDWHSFCAANGLQYNRVHDYEASVLDVLSDIAAAGRASPQDTGDTWTVVIDRALETVTAHITPRNSWGFTGTTAYTQFPDAFRVSFVDETNSYQKAERIVPWPGFAGDPKVFEKLDLPGITNPDQVWKEARKRQYELIHRPHSYEVNQDFEALMVTRGDRVELSHDVLDRNQIAGRVRAVSGNTVILDEDVTMAAGKTYACLFRRGNGSSLLQSVQTAPGTSNRLVITGAGDMPARDDLTMFGESEKVTSSCTVKGVEAMANFTARLSLVDHAPQIEALAAAEVPPAWSGRAGAPSQGIPALPLVPIFGSIDSGRLALDAVTPTNPFPVIVELRSNPLGTTPLATFEVQVRKAGVTAWTTFSGPSGAGAVILSGYGQGDALEMQARGVSVRGVAGDWTGSVFHTVAATNASTPVNLAAVVERTRLSSTSTIVRLRLTADAPTRTDLFLTGRYRAVGATTWTSIPIDPSSRTSILTGALADGGDYTIEGALSTASGADTSSFIPAAGSPVHVVGDVGAPAAPTFTSSTLRSGGPNVDHVLKQSSSSNATRLQLLRAVGFGKGLSDATPILTVDEAPGATDTLTDVADLGLNTYWLKALNASGVASTASSSKSVANAMQVGNLTLFPFDLTNAAWLKTNVTAAISGTGPDGSPATLLSETTTNGVHSVGVKATGLTSGGKIRAGWGVKTAGRSSGRLDLIDSNGSGYARLFFDLAAGTVTISTNSGGIFTSTSASLVKASDDFTLVLFSATAATIAVESRLLLNSAPTTVSYAGDTTKGLSVWGGTLAPLS